VFKKLTNTLNKPTKTTDLELRAGTIAPSFSLPVGPNKTVTLEDFRGQPVVLVFYPNDWSPVCGDQLTLYNELLPEFERYNAVVLGVSVDSVWSHQAFAAARNIRFPLLSDFEPKGAVSKLYGAYNTKKGTAERALFVVDSIGVIQWQHISPSNVNPGAAGILKALENIA
jgi:peroxiredoxin